MVAQQLAYPLVTEKVIARLRLAVVLLVGAWFLPALPPLAGNGLLIAVWVAALAHAAAVVVARPYERAHRIATAVVSAAVDWALIALGLVASGVDHSDLYFLYFLWLLAVAIRCAPQAVMLASAGTALGYVGVVALAHAGPLAVHNAGLRMGYLLVFAVGCSVLVQEARRQIRVRIREEGRRIAVDELTATVGHDLKSPLSTVTGLVEILLDSTIDTLSLDQRAVLHRINANTHQMNDLISNLLDAQSIERGRQPFRPRLVDLNEVVRGVVEAQAHQAEEKQLGLVLDLSPRLPVAMLDAGLIERLIANLLSNAVKFTPGSGAIRVSTRQRDSRIAVEVWDSGPGVPAPLQATLFEKFVRQDDSPGLGLGLYVCKSIVDMHHGTIGMQRTDGGVAFVAELPVAITSGVELPRRTPSAVRLHGHRRRAPRPAQGALQG
jgi:signal transduction histidine kinase